MTLIKKLKLGLAAAALAVTGMSASAHTVQIGWDYEANGDVSFYANNYHGLMVQGGVILGGNTYNFTSSLLTSALPSLDGFIRANYNNNEQFSQKVTVSGLTAGTYNLTTTCLGIHECPYGTGQVTQQGYNVQLNPIVSAVPLPAAGFLLVGALGGMAALRRRKKS